MAASFSAARTSSVEVPHASEENRAAPTRAPEPLTVLIVVPTLQAGAADVGVIDLVQILASAGHRPIVVSRGGRLQPQLIAAGGEFVFADMASKNPLRMLRNVALLRALVHQRKCDIVHAHGRAPGWSAYLAARMTGAVFLTSWYKGFREQNIFKRLYNGVMARGDRIIAVSDQIAELINERYGTPWDRIAVIPARIDAERFDPAAMSAERIEAVRKTWGVRRDQKVILVVGRMIRRKGHHVMVQAMRRLKDMGLKDCVCVFVGEDQQRTHYTGELW
ncbi:MAG: glycosyltransferase, partial [Pseudorhodoplanes sp.]